MVNNLPSRVINTASSEITDARASKKLEGTAKISCDQVTNKIMDTSTPQPKALSTNTASTTINNAASGASLVNQGKVLSNAISMNAHHTSAQQTPAPQGGTPLAQVNTSSSPPQHEDKATTALKNYGVSQENVDRMKTWVKDNNRSNHNLSSLRAPAYFDKDKNKLAYSLVHVPNVPRGNSQSGTYALTGHVIGSGSFNVAQIAVNIVTGELKVFRHGPSTDESENELATNNKLGELPQHFAVGASVEFRSSKGTEVGIIMDYFEGGELLSRLNDKTKPPLTHIEKLEMGVKYFESLAKMHEKKIGHYDQKSENIFLTKNGEPRIGDFGFSRPIGTPIGQCGTPGRMPPELAELGEGDEIPSTVEMDIYSGGCVLADIFVQEFNKYQGTPNELLPKDEFELRKDRYFSAKDNDKHEDHKLHKLLSDCIAYDPGERIGSAAVVAGELRNLLAEAKKAQNIV